MSTYPPDLEAYVQQKIANGEFNSPDEFAIKAASIYRELETRQSQLRSDIQAAIDEIEEGECAPLDVAEIKARLASRRDLSGRLK